MVKSRDLHHRNQSKRGFSPKECAPKDKIRAIKEHMSIILLKYDPFIESNELTLIFSLVHFACKVMLGSGPLQACIIDAD